MAERSRGEEAAKRSIEAAKWNGMMKKWMRMTITVFLILVLVVPTSATAEAEEEDEDRREDGNDGKAVVVQTAYGKLEGVRRSHRIPIANGKHGLVVM